MIKKLLPNIFGKSKKPAIPLFHRLKDEIGGFETVFDVGSYHGDFIQEVLRFNSSINVHAFEPYDESFSNIEKRFRSNNRVQLVHAAVSDTNGTASLNVNTFKETNSLLESEDVDENINSLTKNDGVQTVRLLNLDSYCEANNIEQIDLIKIDTQGNSYNVIKGLEGMLLNNKVGYLYVEAEFTEIYKNEKLFSDIEILLRSLNYIIVDLYNFNYINRTQLGWCDVLFRHKTRKE